MDIYREMFVERLDRQVFSFSEIRGIARDLREDMEEDDALIWLEVEDYGKRLRFLEIDILPGSDLDEMQKLIENYFDAFELPEIVRSSKETRILHFAEVKTMVFLVSLENFESGIIDAEMVKEFITVSRERKARKLLLTSYEKLDDTAIKLLKTSKITFLEPRQVLKKMNELNLDIALDQLKLDLSTAISEKKKIAPFEKAKFGIFLDLVRNASSNMAKKNTLEDLAEYLFSSLEGFSVIERDYRGPSEEIDLLVANESDDALLRSLGTPVAVECRHRKTPASSKDIRDFRGKLEDAGLKAGILITLTGITGNKFDAIAVIREARKARISIVVVSMTDMIPIREGKNPIEVIKECFYKYI